MAGIVQSLGEALRAQVARLPEMPKPQHLIPKWRSCVCNGYAMRISSKTAAAKANPSGRRSAADRRANRILEAQLRTQRELLNSLLQVATRYCWN